MGIMFGFLDKLQPLGLLVLRVGVGVIMIAHGGQKVFGGLHNHLEFVHQLGMPAWWGYLSTATEFLGGILLIAGLFTRIVGVAMTIEMGVAIAKVHWHNGLAHPGGMDLALAIAVGAFALIFFGAGEISLDWVFFRGKPGARKYKGER